MIVVSFRVFVVIVAVFGFVVIVSLFGFSWPKMGGDTGHWSFMRKNPTKKTLLRLVKA